MKLPVAKVEMAKISIFLDGIIQSLVHNLYQRPHVSKILIHLISMGKITEKVKNEISSFFSTEPKVFLP